MKTNSLLICLLFLVFSIKSYCQEKTHALSFKISVAENVQPSFKQNGRLFISIGTNPNVEPRLQTWPNSIRGKHYFFAKNFSVWKANQSLTFDDSDDWTSWARIGDYTFKNIPEGTYYIQILWDQDIEGYGINIAGNMYSHTQKVELTATQSLSFELSEIIEPFQLFDHKLLKLVEHKSDTLSKWWGKPIYERAAVLLPSKYYENLEKQYPIRYCVIGGLGSLSRVNRRVDDKAFLQWWLSDEAPQIITVYLDGEINRNIYHVDSDNKGPSGYSLINELIPYIENLYRGTDSPTTRFTDGCSTGGWGSLALQLFYPETFNGVFSYSPDPLSFNAFFSLNLYRSKNMFFNKYGYPHPISRSWNGNPKVSFKDWIELENVIGYSGTYIDSPNFLGTLNSIFGAKGADGMPVPLFDPETGIIDPEAVISWSRYDLTRYVLENWEDIGSKLQGKIYIWSGTMDGWFFNNGAHEFEKEGILRLKNPKSDAVFEYSLFCSHCEMYSQRRVLEQIANRLEEMDTE